MRIQKVSSVSKSNDACRLTEFEQHTDFVIFVPGITPGNLIIASELHFLYRGHTLAHLKAEFLFIYWNTLAIKLK